MGKRNLIFCTNKIVIIRSFFAIAPNSMNKTLKFNVTISKYDSEAVGLEGDGKVPKIVDADIKSEVDGQGYKWYANSCIPITEEMFGHKCSFGKEVILSRK